MTRRLLALCAACALTTGCSLLAKTVAGDKIDACEKLLQDEVPLDEEVAIGGTVAVGLVQKAGGLVISMPAVPPPEREVEHASWKKSVKLPETPETATLRYLNRVGKNLGAQSARPELEWTFGILDSDALNAFSTPGGYVMISRGLLALIQSEAELAGVLAHEIGHVTGQHVVHEYRAMKVQECKSEVEAKVGAAATSVALHVAAAVAKDEEARQRLIRLNKPENFQALFRLGRGLIDKLATKGLARTDEHDADLVAVELLLNAGYNPEPYIALVKKLPAVGVPFLANHPSPQERGRRLDAWKQQVQREQDRLVAVSDFSALPSIPLEGQLDAVR